MTLSTVLNLKNGRYDLSMQSQKEKSELCNQKPSIIVASIKIRDSEAAKILEDYLLTY